MTPETTRPGSAPRASATAATAAGCRSRGSRTSLAYGFSPDGRSWLPQPAVWAELARDAQVGVPGSTLDFYTRALGLRRAHELGLGELHWIDGYGTDVLAFSNAGVTVIANTGEVPVELPVGEVLLESGPISGGVLPPDTTVWLSAR